MGHLPGDRESEAAPPAGWYADPYGAPRRRYWDGSQWTDDYQAAPVGVHRKTSPSKKTEDGQTDYLPMVSLIASLGSVAFLAAPMMLAAFGFLIALAGAVTGLIATQRTEEWMAKTGALVGMVMAILLGATLL